MAARLLPLGAGLALAVIILLLAVSVFSFNTTAADPQTNSDLRMFYDAGEALNDGRSPYGVYNFNPPILSHAFGLLARLDFPDAYKLVFWSSVALYAGLCLILLWRYPTKRRPLTVLWLLAAPGFWQTLDLGQVYVPIALAAAVAFILIDRPRGPWSLLLAGVFVGVVVTVKPNYAYWPLLLLLAGERRVVASSVLTAVAITIVPVAFSGVGPLRDYVEMMLGVSTSWTHLGTNSSLPSLLVRWGLPSLDRPVAVLILAPIAFAVWRLRLDVRTASSLALVAIPLASALAWSGYLLLLLPVLMMRSWGWPERIAAALLVVPLWIVVDHKATWGAAYSLGMLVLLGALVGEALAPVLARYRRRETAPVPITQPSG